MKVPILQVSLCSTVEWFATFALLRFKEYLHQFCFAQFANKALSSISTYFSICNSCYAWIMQNHLCPCCTCQEMSKNYIYTSAIPSTPPVTSDSKKSGQTAVLYHYCGLSRFFWIRRYTKGYRSLKKYIRDFFVSTINIVIPASITLVDPGSALI